MKRNKLHVEHYDAINASSRKYELGTKYIFIVPKNNCGWIKKYNDPKVKLD